MEGPLGKNLRGPFPTLTRHREQARIFASSKLVPKNIQWAELEKGRASRSMPEKEDKLVAAIADRLRRAEISFVTKKAVGGLMPDFIVAAPDGRQIIVETKQWDFPGFTSQASKQAERYQEAVKADGMFVVIPALKRNMPSKGVVTLEGLIPALQAEFQAKSTGQSQSHEPKVVRRSVFAAMPFAPQYEDVFFLAMRHAADEVNAICERVDRREFQGNIVDEINRMIKRASAVFVDLSESKPNVLYEAGIAHTLKKPCLHLCSTPLDKLPFDVSQWKTTPYKIGQIHKLRQVLTRRLKEVLS